MRRLAVALAMAGQLSVAAMAQTDQPNGTRPTFTDRQLTPVPNSAAILRTIWVPNLDGGFVPQGLTVQDGLVYLSGYFSIDPKQGRGPCWVQRIDPGPSTVMGIRVLPAACGHAGGLARGPAGTIYVADTHHVFAVGIGGSGAAVPNTKLKAKVLGSFGVR